jgi:hypothetical protein
MRRIRSVLLAVLAVVVLLAVAFLFYANLVMRGEREQALLVWENDDIAITSTDQSIVMEPVAGATGQGLLFIPGAKVDPYAYMYKLSGLVESGVTVVITKPTLNLAFFDTRTLDDFAVDAPDVDEWYVGGHSLGGVKACMLADSPEVAGLVLFGSYCANDLSDSDLAVLSVSGSNDGLSTPEKIDANRSNLPTSTDFVEIEGGNHARFGDYGDQAGDGEATISTEEMLSELTPTLVAFFASHQQ